MQAISRAKEPGKWRMLIDALRTVDDSAILDVLLEEQKVQEHEWLTTECKNLIEIFKEDILEYLHLEQLLPVMVEKGLILRDDMARLYDWIDRGNRRTANISFLLIMHRHKSNWYDIFTDVLQQDEHHQELLKKIIGEDKYEKKYAKNDAELLKQSSASPDAEQTSDSFTDRKPLPMDQQMKNTSIRSVPTAQQPPREVLPIETPGDQLRTVPSSNCECGCCKQVLSVMAAMRQDLTFMTEKMSSLEMEVLQLRSELKK